MVQSVLDGVISWKLLQDARTHTQTTKRGLETHPTFPTYLISLFLNIILDYLKAQILRGSEYLGFQRSVLPDRKPVRPGKTSLEHIWTISLC